MVGNLDRHSYCEGENGVAAGLKAWLVREFELGSRSPSEEEFLQLARGFGFASSSEFNAKLEQIALAGSEDLIKSEHRSARRLASDRGSESWPELVPRATSHGFTGDQLVIEGRNLGSNFITANAKILVDRSVRVDVGDLVAALDRSVIIGIGRIKDGVARDEKGRVLKGSVWRVVSMLFP